MGKILFQERHNMCFVKKVKVAQKVKIGIIGCGGMGGYHLGRMSSCGLFDVIGILDIDPAVKKKALSEDEIEEVEESRQPGYSLLRIGSGTGKVFRVARFAGGAYRDAQRRP